jgi:hypothetical protein
MRGIKSEERRLCDNARVASWKKEHPDRVKEYSKTEWQRRKERNPSVMSQVRARSKARYELKLRNNPEAIRRRNLGRYGLTLEQFDAMLTAQGGVCALCGTDQPGGRGNRFCVDHDHITGAVRGLLCTHCNKGIGYFRDDPALLLKATTYLQPEKRCAE